MVYAVDVYPDSAQVVIEYDNNKRRDKTWFQPLNTGDFALFPTNHKILYLQVMKQNILTHF